TALNGHDFDGLHLLLDAERPNKPDQYDLRGFEWRYFWRLCQRDALFSLPGSGGQVATVAFSPDGRRVVAGNGDGTLSVWNVETKQKVASLQGPRNRVWSVAISPNGRTVAAGNDDGTFSLWDLASEQKLISLRAFRDAVTSVALSADGKTLAT